MPRTPIAYTDPAKTGTTLPTATAADVVNGNSVINDGRILCIAKNSSGSTIRNVIVTPTNTVDGLVPAAHTTPIPVSSSLLLGPWEIANYSTTLQISGDSATDVTFLFVHFPG